MANSKTQIGQRSSRAKEKEPAYLRQEAAYSRVADRVGTRRKDETRQRAARTARRMATLRDLIFCFNILLLLVLIFGGGIAALYFIAEYR